MERFEASPEGQDLVRQGGTVGWADTFMDLGMGYLEVTPATMTAEQLKTILFELFPRKVSAEPGCGQEIVAELQAFWRFLRREFGLPNAGACLQVLATGTALRLDREMQNPANFGLAKAFLAQGLAHGFDMATPEGIQAWTEFVLRPDRMGKFCAGTRSRLNRARNSASGRIGCSCRDGRAGWGDGHPSSKRSS